MRDGTSGRRGIAETAALKAHRAGLIDPKAAQYGGQTIKLMGDGALMEFASVVDAVRFAVEVQCVMRDRNADVAEDQRLEFRIGINIGDVIAEDGDIHGDGVNVAARLEGLAQPGGICIRRNVRNQVRDKLDLDLEDLGEVEVKNIERPIRASHIVLNEKAAALATAVVAPPPDKRSRWRQVAAAVALGVAYYDARKYQEAATTLASRKSPNLKSNLYLAAAYAQLGRQDEAQATVQKILEENPDSSIKLWGGAQPYQREVDLNHYIQGLRTAGLPE